MNTGSTSAQMIGTVLSDRYRLEAKLGSGGMSTVYLARDETLDRPVAVKVMHREMSEQADQLQRFRGEARAVAKISHPNVVAVIDAGEDRGHPYIVFEYVEGETLKQRIARVGALDVQEALAYSIEIARALALAHAGQLVHRDVKPQNVLIDVDGRAKLTDFGISRQLEQAGMTATGRVLGTTDYVAPEQAMGHGADPRSDIYSLGVVLYEMLTGEVPFSADSQVGVAMKHVNEELPDVQRRRPEVSAAAALVVERATFKAPERRYQRVDEMIADLETALEVEAARAGSTSGEATSVLDAVPPPRRRLARGVRWSWSGFAMLLAVAAVVLALVYGISSGWFGGGGAGAGGRAGGGENPVKIASATDFDPSGDGEEHSDEVGLAVDGNPTGTAWTTENYEQPDFGKDGVGLFLDAEDPVAANSLELRTPDPGWAFRVYAANDPPPGSLSGWTPVSGEESAESRTEVALDTSGRSFRYYLIWAISPAETSDGYGASISDAKLFD
ncbi:MAG: protein kinase domain-containing protein [Solirubrobacterales bacterium]